MEGAAKALSTEIINTYPLGRMFNNAAEITEREIERWKSQEMEAAYQIYKKGTSSWLPWGYNVEKAILTNCGIR